MHLIKASMMKVVNNYGKEKETATITFIRRSKRTK